MKKAKNVSNKKKNTNAMISTDNEMTKLLLLVLGVIVVFGIFYVITLFVTKKDTTSGNADNLNYEATIQYEKVLAGNILSQKDKEYYVLVYFGDDSYVDYYKNYLMYYSTTVEGAVPYYFVDMDDTFNNGYISDSSKLDVKNSKDFKFSETTLLRIQNGNVISTYQGKENIEGKFGRMTK